MSGREYHYFKDVDLGDPVQFRTAVVGAVNSLDFRVGKVEGKIDWILVLLIVNLATLVVNLIR